MVRREFSAALQHAGVEETRRSDIALVLTEAAGNAVVHAYPPRTLGLLYVDAGIAHGNLLLRICDCGRGMGPRTDSPGLGIGLSLIGRLSDGLEIAPNRTVGGTRVCAMFRDVLTDGAAVRAEAAVRRAEHAMIHDYAEELRVSSEGLRDDMRALMAQAQQAIDQSTRLRAERPA
jgi:anti-sigma regulatory factor (Ser/Thr protein kinase)